MAGVPEAAAGAAGTPATRCVYFLRSDSEVAISVLKCGEILNKTFQGIKKHDRPEFAVHTFFLAPLLRGLCRECEGQEAVQPLIDYITEFQEVIEENIWGGHFVNVASWFLAWCGTQ